VVNLADTWSQAYVDLPHPSLAGQQVMLADQLSTDRYDREGDELLRSGLYVDVGPWAHHVFHVTP
jgi:hypothetical protein